MNISNLRLRSLACALFLIFGFSAFAQNSFSVSLRLVDEKTDDPVGFATVSLTVKGEKTAGNLYAQG